MFWTVDASLKFWLSVKNNCEELVIWLHWLWSHNRLPFGYSYFDAFSPEGFEQSLQSHFMFFPLKLSVTLISYRINSKSFKWAFKATCCWASACISKLMPTFPPLCNLYINQVECVIRPHSSAILSYSVQSSFSPYHNM